MTAENRDKVKMLFDLVLIANDVLPEQDRLSFDYSKGEMFATVYAIDTSEPVCRQSDNERNPLAHTQQRPQAAYYL